MLRTRVIPSLQLVDQSLVKARRFTHIDYIGDPRNTVAIFNDLEADELLFLDIRASVERRKPNYAILAEIASHCFMPLSYGGGISSVEEVRRILAIGFEKVVVNSAAHENPALLTAIAEAFGSQCLIASIDVRKSMLGRYEVCTMSGTKRTRLEPVEYARKLEKAGAGEILLTSIDREGTWNGYDRRVVSEVNSAVSVPVIACGGAASLKDMSELVAETNVAAVAAGSLFVYQKKDLGVLINYPSRRELEELFP